MSSVTVVPAPKKKHNVLGSTSKFVRITQFKPLPSHAWDHGVEEVLDVTESPSAAFIGEISNLMIFSVPTSLGDISSWKEDTRGYHIAYLFHADVERLRIWSYQISCIDATSD